MSKETNEMKLVECDESISSERGLCVRSISSFINNPVVECVLMFTIAWIAIVLIICGLPTQDDSSYQTIFWSISLLTPLYTIETFLRVISARLFYDRNSYFRNPWTTIDFILLAVSWSELCTVWFGVSGILSPPASFMFWRLFGLVRIGRLLPSIRNFEALNVMYEVSKRGLYNCRMVYLLIATFILFNCCLGVSFFRGQLRYMCAVLPLGNRSAASSNAETALLGNGSSWNNETAAPLVFAYPERFCRPAESVISNWGYSCGDGETCVFLEAPAFSGVLNFDQVGSALMTVLLTILIQDYESIMLALMDGSAPVSCIYFIFIIVLGSLFLLNYTYAILCLTIQELHIETHTGGDGSTGTLDGVLLQLGVEDIVVSHGQPRGSDGGGEPEPPTVSSPSAQRPVRGDESAACLSSSNRCLGMSRSPGPGPFQHRHASICPLSLSSLSLFASTLD